MKKTSAIIAAVIVVLVCVCSSHARGLSGSTNLTALEYRDLMEDGDGYNITLVNRDPRGIVEVDVVVYAMDVHGTMVGRWSFYVDFIPGNSQVSYMMHGYNPRIFKWGVRVTKVPQVRSR